MDDERLEKQLRLSAREAERFFASWRFEPLRQVVARRAAGPVAHPRPHRRALALAGLAAALLFLLVARPGEREVQFPGGPGLPVAQQAIRLDRREASQWLSYFRLRRPDAASASLLAVVWTEGEGGDWRPLYSNLLGSGDEPLPAVSLDLPGSPHPLVLLAARDAGREFLDYNVIGYAGDRVLSYRTRQALPGGSVTPGQGVLVERLAAGAGDAPGAWQVTYLLPYQLRENGELLLPGRVLRLEVGQFLELMGSDGGEVVRAVFQRGLLRAEAEGRFYAERAGDELLTLVPRDDPSRARQLLVQIVQP